MNRLFEELDYRDTPIGPISLRRRFHPLLKVDVFEIILGDEHLMSNIFTVSEIALARLGLDKLASLSADDRCQIVRDDFFALAQSDTGFDADHPGRQFHAILIDIDHTPDWLLDARSGHFYSEAGLRKLLTHLKPGGLMGLWSDVPPDEAFVQRLSGVFAEAWGEPVTFYNPLQDKHHTQAVYLGFKAA